MLILKVQREKMSLISKSGALFRLTAFMSGNNSSLSRGCICVYWCVNCIFVVSGYNIANSIIVVTLQVNIYIITGKEL